MGRFAVTAVFEVGPGKVPHGADVLDRLRISDMAVHRFSYCDGRTLSVVIDWTAAGPEEAARDASVVIRLVWAQLAGADPGTPLTVRVRPLTPPAKVSAGAVGTLPRDHPEGFRSTARMLLDPGLEVAPDRPPDRRHRRDRPDDDPDDGGLAGVREPRRPKPGPGHLSAALQEPRTGI